MIRISKATAINVEGEESLFVAFPYNPTLVDKVKSLKVRRYEPNSKSWEVSIYDIKKLIELFDGYEVSIAGDVDVNIERPLSEHERMVLEGGRVALFAEELSLIQTEMIRDFAKDLLDKIPMYFFTVPASSTGKYHPKYALGEGGLVRHTRAAMKIANELLNNDSLAEGITVEEKDAVLVALLFHDSLKHGISDDGGHTIFNHPQVASDWIQDRYEKGETLEMPSELLDTILDCIDSHMGQFNKPYGGAGSEELPLPKTRLQKLTHLADYLASRKFLEVEFD